MTASTARQKGDEAHQYHFWRHAVGLLRDANVASVGYETGHFKCFDDVAVRYNKQMPDHCGGTYKEDHIQSKFSVANGKHISAADLIDPTLINASTYSLLENLQEAVAQADKEDRSCLFRMLTPWPPAQGDLFEELIDKTQGAIRFEVLFQGKTIRSKSGKVRKLWGDKLGIDMNDEAEFRRILGPLRFEQDTRTLERLRTDLAELLPTAGLKQIDVSAIADSYPALIQRLSYSGQKWFDKNAIIEACKQDNLWLGTPSLATPRRNLGIRSFLRYADHLEADTHDLLCLTDAFSGRKVRDVKLWNQDLLPQLRTFLSRNVRHGERYTLHIPTHSSIAFATGYLIEPKIGANIEVIQNSPRGRVTWSADGPSGADADWSVSIHDYGRSDEIAVAVTVAQPVREAVEKHIQSLDISKLLHFDLGASSDSIKDGPHAFKCSQELWRLVREKRGDSNGRVHLFWAGPNAMALMLGQLARPEEVTLYEYDFEGTKTYEPSILLDPSIRLS